MNRIVYLHGFSSGPNSTKALFFAARFAGCGIPFDAPALDAGDFEHLTISGQLRVIEEHCRDEPVTLMGSSMGGYLAALYAARHPEVRRLVLMAPAFRFAQRWSEIFSAEKVEGWRRSGSLEVFHYGQARHVRLSFGLIEDAQQYEDFPDFPQPALIFHGRNDTVVPAGLSVDFAATHPNVRLSLLDSGHELTDVLDPMWDAIGDFWHT